MNAVILVVLLMLVLMLVLTLVRINVIIAMTVSAIVSGLVAGLGLTQTLDAFNQGLSGGAQIALSYAMLGAFAVAISKSGLTSILADKLLSKVQSSHSEQSKTLLSFTLLTVILLCSVAEQNISGSMILGGLTGVIVFTLFGTVKCDKSSDLFTKGVAMMAMIGFIMISAQVFASVMKSTGNVASLVQSAASFMEGNKPLAAAVILLVGLLITMGISSSFSTVPIIATLFVPLCLELGFSVMAINTKSDFVSLNLLRNQGINRLHNLNQHTLAVVPNHQEKLMHKDNQTHLYIEYQHCHY